MHTLGNEYMKLELFSQGWLKQSYVLVEKHHFCTIV